MWVWLVTLCTCDSLLVTSYCFKRDLMLMFSCQLALCQPFPVWGLVFMGLGDWFALVGCGGSTCGGGIFYWIWRPLICNFTGYVSLLQLFFVPFDEADYFPGFYVDQSGGKGLIVTWRQILKCGITRESMHMGEGGRAYICVCAYMCAQGDALLCPCGCLHGLWNTYLENFNCM